MAVDGKIAPVTAAREEPAGAVAPSLAWLKLRWLFWVGQPQ